MSHSRTQPPTQPRQGNGRKVSQRGLLSIVMLLVCVSTFGIAMLGGAKIVHDILGSQPQTGLFAPVVALGVAYAVGWLTAMVGIRVYGNLVLPILINLFIWIALAGICYLYVEIMQRLYLQAYDPGRFFKYVIVMLAGLTAMVGLHLIIEEHNLRPLSIPLLLFCLMHLGLIVYRYVFVGGNAAYLPGDLFFLSGMSAFAILMLAHVGLLDSLRLQITNHFDRNSKSIRTED